MWKHHKDVPIDKKYYWHIAHFRKRLRERFGREDYIEVWDTFMENMQKGFYEYRKMLSHERTRFHFKLPGSKKIVEVIYNHISDSFETIQEPRLVPESRDYSEYYTLHSNVKFKLNEENEMSKKVKSEELEIDMSMDTKFEKTEEVQEMVQETAVVVSNTMDKIISAILSLSSSEIQTLKERIDQELSEREREERIKRTDTIKKSIKLDSTILFRRGLRSQDAPTTGNVIMITPVGVGVEVPGGQRRRKVRWEQIESIVK